MSVASARIGLPGRSLGWSESRRGTGFDLFEGVTLPQIAGISSIVAAAGLLTVIAVSALSGQGQNSEGGVVIAAVGVLFALVTGYLGAESLTPTSPTVLAASAFCDFVAATLGVGYLVLVGAPTLSTGIVLIGVVVMQLAAAALSMRAWPES